jgi:S1-C subfamily serine protease
MIISVGVGVSLISVATIAGLMSFGMPRTRNVETRRDAAGELTEESLNHAAVVILATRPGFHGLGAIPGSMSGMPSPVSPPEWAPPLNPRLPPATKSLSGDPVRQALAAVAIVSCGGQGHGSGFVAAPGILVTNHHVIRDARVSDVRVMFPDNHDVRGRRFSVTLLYVDAENDLAFLAIPEEVNPLILDPSYVHSNGQRVVAIGSPGVGGGEDVLPNLTTDGRLGPEFAIPSGPTFWSLSMAVNPGNSGGPILDADTGIAIGVVAAKFTRTAGQSLAVPFGKLHSGLAKARAAGAEDLRAAASLHRQRYCLLKMAEMVEVAGFAVRRSIKAALTHGNAEGTTPDAVFNECKALVAKVLAEKVNAYELIIAGEVEMLEEDGQCPRDVRIGIERLHGVIDRQIELIRAWVPGSRFRDFLEEFEGTLNRSHELVRALEKTLAFDAELEAE